MVFFVYFALICCLVLGGIFLFLSHSRENKMQTYYMQEKIELLLQDFELQQQNFQEIALRLAINEKYHYSVLAEEKYNENILLQDFENYRFSSILTDELFLYYTGRSNIFHITGSTINLDVYLNALQESEKTALKNALANPGNTVQMVSTQSAIYILTPFKAGSLVADPPRAILGCVIPIEKLARRFEAVSGGLDGTVALYADGNLLYCECMVITWVYALIKPHQSIYFIFLIRT